MSAGKLIGFVAAAILILFGVLFMWAAFSPDTANQWGTLFTGIAIVGAGLILIFFASRSKPAAPADFQQNVTLNVDLPGNVQLEKITCQNCGNPLSKNDIKIVAGAPTVNCPYCGQVYQLTEEPKW
ncbi:MAG: hypothetical protein FVQ83_05005 [Chloroflexi bacterium]|nr:hypothetical protein [Chloroflexota bacterium]